MLLYGDKMKILYLQSQIKNDIILKPFDITDLDKVEKYKELKNLAIKNLLISSLNDGSSRTILKTMLVKTLFLSNKSTVIAIHEILDKNTLIAFRLKSGNENYFISIDINNNSEYKIISISKDKKIAINSIQNMVKNLNKKSEQEETFNYEIVVLPIYFLMIIFLVAVSIFNG